MSQPPPTGPPWSGPPVSAPGGPPSPGAAGWTPPGWSPPPGAWLPPAPAKPGTAVAALILGIVSFVVFCVGPVTSVLAIVLGHQALGTIAASQGRLGGTGMARAGAILGWVFVGLMVAAAALVLVILLTGGSISGGGSVSSY